MMDIDQFDQDFEVEGIISQWLERYYFNQKLNRYTYVRCEIPEYQKRGIDAAIKNPDLFKDDEWRYIDEKAASSYIRTDLKEDNIHTFAFELDCKRRHSEDSEDRVPGWLFGKKYSQTDYYLLSWVWADIEKLGDWGGGFGNKEQVHLNNILKVKCLLVPKVAVQEFVSDYGVNQDNFMYQAKQARISNEEKIRLSNGKTPNIQHSTHLEEEPVNIIISEYHLEDMAIDSFEVEI